MHPGHEVNDYVHVPFPLYLKSVELGKHKPKILHCIVPCHLLQEQAQVLEDQFYCGLLSFGGLGGDPLVGALVGLTSDKLLCPFLDLVGTEGELMIEDEKKREQIADFTCFCGDIIFEGG